MLKAGAQGTKGCYYNKELYVKTYIYIHINRGEVLLKFETSSIYLNILQSVFLQNKIAANTKLTASNVSYIYFTL